MRVSVTPAMSPALGCSSCVSHVSPHIHIIKKNLLKNTQKVCHSHLHESCTRNWRVPCVTRVPSVTRLCPPCRCVCMQGIVQQQTAFDLRVRVCKCVLLYSLYLPLFILPHESTTLYTRFLCSHSLILAKHASMRDDS